MSMTPLWPKRIMSFLVLLNENNHPPSNICQTANPKMPHLPVHGKVFWSHLSGNYQICLVGAYNPFEKCARQIGSSPNTGENKNISNHHPVSYWLFVILDTVLPFCWLHQRGKLQIHNWFDHQNPDINIGLLKFPHKLGSTVDGWHPAPVDMVQ